MKTPSLVVVVGVSLTLLCAGLSRLEDHVEFMGNMSLKAYDVFMRRIQEPPKSGRVVLVDIDEDSLAEYGQWPWPRYEVARLTQKLLDAGASVVAFDIVFAEPDGKSPIAVRDTLRSKFGVNAQWTGVPEEVTDYDRVFAETLSKARTKTILGCFMTPVEGIDGERIDDVPDADPCYRGYFNAKGPLTAGDYRRFLIHARKLTISTRVLSEAAGNNAFFNAHPDADNIVRRIPLVVAYGSERIYPALAIEAVRMDMGLPWITIEYGDHGIYRLSLRDTIIPTDLSGRLIVNFCSPDKTAEGKGFHSFPTYPARDVLSGKAGAESFSNKIVFVGTSAPGLKDMRATPLTPEFAGVEVHATMVDNILSGSILCQPWWAKWVDVLAILLLGGFLTILIGRGRAVLSFFLTLFAVLLAIEASYLMFSILHFVFVPVRLVMSAIIIYPVLTAIRYWQEERQKKQIRNMFGTMVSTDVLNYMENNPGSFSLTGHRAEATIFFSDVAGFTTISEALDPGRLSELLNRYLSPMTRIIMDRRGYVDKYEGDLIMAEWAVPYPIEDHALQGCLAALEQQAKLNELRPMLKQEFGHDIHVRMGINSGTVIAGNMGSDRRFSYTVMGDAVNMARRFEPINRDYATQIIIGEETYEAAKSSIEARLLDKIVVKGKSRPLKIYELIGSGGTVTEVKMQAVRLYEKSLEFFWNRQWDEAIAALEKAMLICPEDGPSAVMIIRVKEYRANPPGPEWSGEYTREAKD